MSIVLATDDDIKTTYQATSLCKQIGSTLVNEYPQVRWYVDVNLKGGVAHVMCADVSMKYGYAIHIDKIAMDLEKAAKVAGGEILERFKRNGTMVGGDAVAKRGEA